MNFTGLEFSWNSTCNNTGKLRGRCNPGPVSFRDDMGGYAPGLSLFTIVVENVGQLLLAEIVNDFFSGCIPAFIHPHIKWSVCLVAEASFTRIKL